jgi:hypothetical protein
MVAYAKEFWGGKDDDKNRVKFVQRNDFAYERKHQRRATFTLS